MNHGIRVYETGGPEVLKYEQVPDADPADDEILIRHTAIGLNFIDTYHRTGLYPLPLPFTPGTEGAGVVEKAGQGVRDLKPGDRIAYVSSPGSYCERRIIKADRAVKIPETVSDEIAAAAMLKGMTAEYLLNRTYNVKPGETILFHAVAGGVGLIACQWAKALGAIVIGTAGSREKAELAKDYGCDHVILYKEENFVERVREITEGKGVPVVYDSVGKDTFMNSLDCLQPRGLMVSFGNSSGPVEPFPLGVLSQKGSLYVTRPSLWHYTSHSEDYQASAGAVFKMIGAGKIKIKIEQRYELKNAAQAHRDLESRKTAGSSILYIA